MVWLTWRQHRAQALVTVLLLAGVALLLVLDSIPFDLVKALPWLPALVGMFWGVPLLAREYERGTDRLMWSQSVPRARWLAVKFGVLGAGVAVSGLALGAVVLAWTATPEAGLDRFSDELFGGTGILPAAWFLAAFALGAGSGAVLRRMLPAMAVTMGVFTALVIGSYVARGYYAEPLVAISDERGIVIPEHAMVTGSGVLDADGNLLSWEEATSACGDVEPVGCMRDRGYVRQYMQYQPADRYWRFQWTEAGLLMVITLVLAGVTARQVVSRSR